MHFVRGKPPEAHTKRREVALGRPGFDPRRAEVHLAEFKVIPRLRYGARFLANQL
jgi:hypothetical protein